MRFISCTCVLSTHIYHTIHFCYMYMQSESVCLMEISFIFVIEHVQERTNKTKSQNNLIPKRYTIMNINEIKQYFSIIQLPLYGNVSCTCIGTYLLVVRVLENLDACILCKRTVPMNYSCNAIHTDMVRVGTRVQYTVQQSFSNVDNVCMLGLSENDNIWILKQPAKEIVYKSIYIF